MQNRVDAGALPPSARTIWWALFLAGAAWLAFHFAMSFLWVMPLNPIKWQLRYVMNAYMQPRFTQNWAFFAPIPPMSDRWVIARVRYHCGSHTMESPWLNVTSFLDAAVSRNRLSPLESVHLVLANTSGDYLNAVSATRYRNRRTVADSIAPLDRLAMDRTSLAVLEQLAPPGASVSHVQVAIIEHDYPRFNERFHSDSHRQGVKMTNWQKASYVSPFARVDFARFPQPRGGCAR